MKTIILAVLAIGVIGLSSCKKEPIPQPNPIVNLLIDEEPQSLVDSLGTIVFDNPLIWEVTWATNAVILDYPIFLDYDPFTNALVRRGTESVDLCIKGLELTGSQKEQLTKAFNSKIECQKTSKSTVSTTHREIEAWAKYQKEYYYNNWYLVERAKLVNSLKLGLLTEAQYKEKIIALEKRWEEKMAYLNQQVKEKIKNHLGRYHACEIIKNCEKIYLHKVLDILGKADYKKWIECYKHHYRKK